MFSIVLRHSNYNIRIISIEGTFLGHPVDSLVNADNMADNMSNSATEENVNISLEDLLNILATLQLDIKSITVEKGKLKWMKSFEPLKKFVETSLQLKGRHLAGI